MGTCLTATHFHSNESNETCHLTHSPNQSTSKNPQFIRGLQAPWSIQLSLGSACKTPPILYNIHGD